MEHHVLTLTCAPESATQPAEGPPMANCWECHRSISSKQEVTCGKCRAVCHKHCFRQHWRRCKDEAEDMPILNFDPMKRITRCRNCREVGHWARECSKKMKPEEFLRPEEGLEQVSEHTLDYPEFLDFQEPPEDYECHALETASPWKEQRLTNQAGLLLLDSASNV